MDFMGNVYRNDITGTEWRIIDINEDGTDITLMAKSGHCFNTNKYLMANYSYIGTEFSK